MGVPFTLTPAKDGWADSDGRRFGWTRGDGTLPGFDTSFFAEGDPQLNSPATFTPTKAGTTTLRFNDGDEEWGEVTLTILAADAPEPNGDTPGSSTARSPGDAGTPLLWLALALAACGGAALLLRRRARA